MSDESETARGKLEAALRPLCPRGWVWVTDERDLPTDEQHTRVQLLQRSIDPGRNGSTAAHRVGFVATITVPSTDPAVGEAQLDDDIVAFLYALTDKHIQWTTATKAKYDGRLGYQLGIEIGTRRGN